MAPISRTPRPGTGASRSAAAKAGARRRRRLPLLTGSALVAIAGAAGIAHGQAAFQGRATVSGGTVSYSTAGNNTDVFTVSSPSAIIDWTPTDTSGTGTIDFLPTGKTGIFQSSTSQTFTVLNRINPTDPSRPVEFDGHVISQFVNASGAASRAGNVWFYTPGGIVVGASGVFDVGSLILTTNAIDTTNGVPAPGSGIKFTGASGSVSNITVQPGAHINATNPGSYVALVAPRINQGGTVTVNGSVGYVAAEAADITIDAGLFTITDTIGSQVAAGGETTLTHTGTTTGAAATDANAPHNIYMVAIPKNDAVTMLVSGTVGYQAATTANVVNGTIVLGAGETYPDGTPDMNVEAGGGQASTIRISGASLTSIGYAHSNGSLSIDTGLGDVAVSGGLGAYANDAISLHVTNGHTITADSLVLENTVDATGTKTGIPIDIGVDAGGTLSISDLAVYDGTYPSGGTGGTIQATIAGTATFGSLGLYADNFANGGGGPAATGGLSQVTVDGGTLSVSGVTRLEADGEIGGGTSRLLVTNNGSASLGDLAVSASADQGTATGAVAAAGAATVGVSQGGTLNVAGTLQVDASASATGATATRGGTALLQAQGGTINLTGTTVASGLTASAAGGAATGGTAQIDGAAGTITVAGSVSLSAGADGGQSSVSGTRFAAIGGTAQIDAAAGTVSLAGVTLYAGASGGAANGGVDGGDAIGGTARITTTAPTGTITTQGNVYLEADGFADSANSADFAGPSSDGASPLGIPEGIANGTGGTTEVIARGGTIQFNADPGGNAYLSMIPDGLGGYAAAAGRDVATSGIGHGGTVRLIADDGGAVSIAGQAYLSPYGTGGGGVSTAAGGTAIGGSVTVGTGLIDGGAGTIRFASMDLDAGAFGGNAGTAGNAIAPTVSVIANPGGTIAGTTLTIEDYAHGGTGAAAGAAGGMASGGTTSVTAAGGTIDIGASDGGGGLTIAATNRGGTGADGGAGGAATGGTTLVSASGGGQLLGTTWTIGGGATGGAGAAGVTGIGGVGGAGSGGAVSVTMSGGTATIGTLAVSSANSGGAGGAGEGFVADPNDPTLVQSGLAGGAGGTASGGTATVALGGGTLGTGALTVATVAAGGVGGAGGGGAGTSATGAAAAGGVGGDGGGSSGGLATISATGGTLTATTTMVTSGAGVGASAGGAGGTGSDGTVAASGATGSGAGGSVALSTDDGGSLSLGAVTLVADALAGGDGAAGGIGIQTADSDGTASAAPITMASLTASNAGAASAQQTVLTIATPIAIAGDASFTGTTAFTLGGTGSLTVGGALSVNAASIAGTQASAGQPTLTAGTASLTTTGGDLTLDTLTTTIGDINLDSAGALSVASLNAAGSLTASSATDLSIGTATAALDLLINAQTSIDVTTATAGRDAAIYTIIAGDDTSIRPRNTVVGSVTAGDDAVVTAWGSVDVGSITTTGLGEDGTDSTGYGNIAGSGVTLYAGSGIHVGAITTLGDILASNQAESYNGVPQSAGTGGVQLDSVTTQGTVSAISDFGAVSLQNLTASSVSAKGASVAIGGPGALTVTLAQASAGDVTIDAGGALDLTAAPVSATGGGISLTSGGALGFATMTADNDITVQAAGALTGASQTSGSGSISDSATGLVDIATLSAGDTIDVDAGDTGHFVTLAAGTAAGGSQGAQGFGSIGLHTVGDLVIDTSATAAGSIGLLSSAGRISAPTLTAGGTDGGVAVLAARPIALGAVTAPGLLYVGGPAAVAGLGPDPATGDLIALLATSGPVASGADVTIGAVRAGAATIAAGTTLALTGTFATTGGAATVSAGGNLIGGAIASYGAFSATSSGGTVTLGDVNAGTMTGGGGITLAGSGGVTAGNLNGAGSVAATSGSGAVTLANLISTGGTVRVTATGNLTTGDVSAAGSIYLTGAAAITAGNLTAGTGPLLFGEGGSAGGTDPATGGIATGFAQYSLDRCDDCSTATIALPFSVDYFGNNYANTYISNNGYLTFNYGQGDYTPSGLATNYAGQAIIAAFFADVDTSNPASGTVSYGTGTFAGRQAFGATWNGVGYFAGHADKVNTFQIILTNRADTGTGNFDVYYNYGNIGWETGEASGGTNGLGGTSAAVGFNAGTGNQAGTYYQLPGSLVPGSFIDGGTAPLISGTNDGIAGQLLFTVRNGQVVVGGAIEPPTVHVTNIAAGNTADIQLGNISGEGAEVHGAGQVTVGTVSVGDRQSGVTAPGNAFATVLDASNGLIAGDISGAGFVAIGAAQGDISTGTITSGSSVAVLGDGAIALGAVTTGQGPGDTMFVSGTGGTPAGFDFDTLLAGKSFDPTTLATAGLAGTGGDVTIAGPITAGQVRIDAGGAFSAGTIGASGAVQIAAGSGLTTADITALGGVSLQAGDGIATSGIMAGGDIGLTATGDVTTGALASSGGGLAIAGGSVSTGAIGATGAVSLGGTSIAVGGALSGGTLVASSSGGFTSGVITTSGNASVSGAGITIGGASAGGTLALVADGTLTLQGDVDAADIALTSHDIAAAGQIGSSRTATLTFTDSGGGSAYVGAAGATANDYDLSATEVGNAHAATIAILAPGAQGAPADILLGDLALSSTNLIGGTASLAFNASGNIKLVGRLAVTGVATGNQISLTAGQTITGVLPAAGISLTDASGGLAGTLNLNAQRIEFDTPATAQAVAAATTLGARSDALAASDGVAAPASYIQAGGVSFTVGSALYLQNSGIVSTAGADRYGVTAGAGGISLAGLGTTPVEVVLNGRVTGASGDITGADVVAQLKLAGDTPVTFAPQSTVNGCLADGTPCAPAAPSVDTIERLFQPVQDVVQQVDLVSGLGRSSAYSFETPQLISMTDLAPATLPPLIDEPVTGAGNDNLWVGIGVGTDQAPAPMGGAKPGTKPSSQ